MTEDKQITEEQLDKIRLEYDIKQLELDKRRLDNEEKEIDNFIDYSKKENEQCIQKTECETARRNIEQINTLVNTVTRSNGLYSGLLLGNNGDVIKEILKTNLAKLVNK